ncbi:hypothetical protein [Actinomadura harenae]|uniref:Uncharacterized protein n=1 Tax=Actinomadura harenae TaxID=2483351 RepID=A0A3M2M4E9_9ACTN|nr:hypothetical protein [Actinomadura harenae]RMI43325.1 hypothetical protein EBO15_16730 [Actinomadura harenae]
MIQLVVPWSSGFVGMQDLRISSPVLSCEGIDANPALFEWAVALWDLLKEEAFGACFVPGSKKRSRLPVVRHAASRTGLTGARSALSTRAICAARSAPARWPGFSATMGQAVYALRDGLFWRPGWTPVRITVLHRPSAPVPNVDVATPPLDRPVERWSVRVSQQVAEATLEALWQFLSGVLILLRRLRVLLLIALTRVFDQTDFTSVLLATVRRFGRRGEPSDGLSLPLSLLDQIAGRSLAAV